MSDKLWVWALIGWSLMLVGAMGLVATTLSAQPRPFQAYPIYGGCLYITAQGYAVVREWAPDVPRDCR